MPTFRMDLVQRQEIIKLLINLTKVAIPQGSEDEEIEVKDSGDGDSLSELPPLFKDLFEICSNLLDFKKTEENRVAKCFIRNDGAQLIYYLSTSSLFIKYIPFISLFVLFYVLYSKSLSIDLRDAFFSRLFHLSSFGSPQVQEEITKLADDHISNPFNYSNYPEPLE